MSACPDGSPQLEALKRQKDRLKSDSPAFIPSVTLEGGCSAAHVRAYTGYVMVDIDGIADEALPKDGKEPAEPGEQEPGGDGGDGEL